MFGKAYMEAEVHYWLKLKAAVMQRDSLLLSAGGNFAGCVVS